MSQYSVGLLKALAVTGSLRATLNGGFLRYYSGTMPASADDAVAGAVLALFTEQDDGTTGLTFGATATDVGGAVSISKTGSEDWQATGLAAAGVGTTPTFARWCMTGDDGTGAAVSDEIRFQCPIGPAVVNGIIRTGTVAEDDPLTLASFTVALPTGG